jgi:hypothetical protein
MTAPIPTPEERKTQLTRIKENLTAIIKRTHDPAALSLLRKDYRETLDELETIISNPKNLQK